MIRKLENIIIEIISAPSGEDIGFCFSIKDPFIENTIIIKSIGIMQSYQKKGVGAALMHSHHKNAESRGARQAIYALIRTGNTVTQLPYPGAVSFRKYISMEKMIN